MTSQAGSSQKSFKQRVRDSITSKMEDKPHGAGEAGAPPAEPLGTWRDHRASGAQQQLGPKGATLQELGPWREGLRGCLGGGRGDMPWLPRCPQHSGVRSQTPEPPAGETRVGDAAERRQTRDHHDDPINPEGGPFPEELGSIRGQVPPRKGGAEDTAPACYPTG